MVKKTRRFAWANQLSYLTKLRAIKADIIIQRNSSHLSYVIKKYCDQNKAFFVWICTDDDSPHKNVHIIKYKRQFSIKDTPKIKYIIFYLNALIMDILRLKGLNGVSLAFTQNDYQRKILQKEHKILSSRMISAHPKEKSYYLQIINLIIKQSFGVLILENIKDQSFLLNLQPKCLIHHLNFN